MTGRWKICKSSLLTPTPWIVFEPDWSWSAAFATWGEAMAWANSAGDFSACVEYWLEQQGMQQ